MKLILHYLSIDVINNTWNKRMSMTWYLISLSNKQGYEFVCDSKLKQSFKVTYVKMYINVLDRGSLCWILCSLLIWRTINIEFSKFRNIVWKYHFLFLFVKQTFLDILPRVSIVIELRGQKIKRFELIIALSRNKIMRHE